jgi:hypothetical protein
LIDGVEEEECSWKEDLRDDESFVFGKGYDEEEVIACSKEHPNV